MNELFSTISSMSHFFFLFFSFFPPHLHIAPPPPFPQPIYSSRQASHSHTRHRRRRRWDSHTTAHSLRFGKGLTSPNTRSRTDIRLRRRRFLFRATYAWAAHGRGGYKDTVWAGASRGGEAWGARVDFGGCDGWGSRARLRWWLRIRLLLLLLLLFWWGLGRFVLRRRWSLGWGLRGWGC